MGSREPAEAAPDALFEHHPDPTLRYGPPDGGADEDRGAPVVLAVNPAFEAAFDGTTDASTGRSLREVVADLGDAEAAAAVLDAARSGEPAAGRCHPEGDEPYRYRLIPTGADPPRGHLSCTPIPAPAEGPTGSGDEIDLPGVDGAELAATVAHDLRNPLEVAKIRLDAARDTGDAVHFEKAAAALDRIDRLVTEVLALPDDGIDPEPVALADAAADAWETVDTGDATLSVEAERTVSADPARLRRLFENLFRNSVEHGSTGSRTQSDDSAEHGGASVVVGASGEGTVTFWVADDGPGIPEAERERVFEPGYSGDGGTGLGLSIVGQVARAHGWSVSVGESEAGGARFEIGGVEPAA